MELAYTFKFLCRVIFGIGDNYRGMASVVWQIFGQKVMVKVVCRRLMEVDNY